VLAVARVAQVVGFLGRSYFLGLDGLLSFLRERREQP
jgi:hypothetical protein